MALFWSTKSLATSLEDSAIFLNGPAIIEPFPPIRSATSAIILKLLEYPVISLFIEACSFKRVTFFSLADI